MLFNQNDTIEKCCIDFRTHKGNGKINGLYALRIEPGHFSRFSLNYISRDGVKGPDFVHLLPTILFKAIIPGELTLELVDEIIYESVKVINQIAGIKHRQFITLDCDYCVTDIVDIEKQIIDFIKQIKGEIPLPHLQANIEKFIEANSKYKKQGKKRTLKNLNLGEQNKH